MGKSRELADLIGQTGTTEQILSGRRNHLINGEFSVWQRGTSFSTTAGVYTVDRWRTWGGNNVTVTKTANGLNMYGTSTNGTMLLEYRMEELYLAGKTVTLSVKVGANCTNMSVMLYTRTSNNGDWQYTPLEMVLTANSIKSATFDIPSDAGQINLRLYATGTGYGELDIENIQLEEGSVATPFEHRSYGEELALCQRYYYSELGQPETIRMTTTINTYRVAGGTSWPTTMRVAPTAIVYSVGQETAGKINLYNNSSTDVGVNMYVVGETVHGFKGVYGATSSGLTSGAWYSYKVTADAEL